MTSGQQRTKGVDSARRALQILLQFSESRPELTVDHILDSYEISVPSAYRYISLLREMDLIEERSKGIFVLSPRVLKLARAAETVLDYRAEALPILEQLSRDTEETALYLRRVNESAVCLAIVESEHPVTISFQPGLMMPLHGGAAAKILLSEYEKREQYLERVGQAMTPETYTRLVTELRHIKEEGFAESASEVDEGVWAAAAAIRMHGVLVGALSVAAPAYRLGEESKAEIAQAVKKSAASLEQRLIERY